MSELANPHDSFFKDLLARPDTAADFLANYLPPEVAAELDVSAPELVKDSFVDAELQQHFSDLIYLSKGAGKVTESEFAGALKQAFPAQGEKAMQTMIDTWIEQGVQQGRQEGRQEGIVTLTLRQLQRRIGNLDAQTQARISVLSIEQLKQLGEALLDFTQPADLAAWLLAHA